MILKNRFLLTPKYISKEVLFLAMLITTTTTLYESSLNIQFLGFHTKHSMFDLFNDNSILPLLFDSSYNFCMKSIQIKLNHRTKYRCPDDFSEKYISNGEWYSILNLNCQIS